MSDIQQLYVYGKLNKEIALKQYSGKDTDTAKTIVDNTDSLISVEVIKVPHKLSIKQAESLFTNFDGSEDIVFDLTPYAKKTELFKSATLVDNTLSFYDASSTFICSVALSGFVQEQSDLAQTDNTKETFVKNKSTIYLTNAGDPNPTITGDTSKYATENYVSQYGGKIDKIKVNDVEQTIVDKTVNITVPTKTSDLTNDSDFTTTSAMNTAIASAMLVEQIARTAADTNLQTAIDNHTNNKSNPHEVTKAQVGLSNVTDDAQVKRTEMGVANGVATLDSSSKVPLTQLPTDQLGKVDDVKINNSSIVTDKIANITYETAISGDSSNAATTTAIRSFVNSSIASETANFIGTFNIIDDLGLTRGATHAEVIAKLNQLHSTGTTNNDYCFVAIPDVTVTTQIAQYDRYKYKANATPSATWDYEYTLNNSSFTASQWNAINSGIDSTKTAQITTNATNIASLQNDKVDKTTTIADINLQTNITRAQLVSALIDNTTINKNNLNQAQAVALHIGDNIPSDLSGTTWQLNSNGNITFPSASHSAQGTFSVDGSITTLVRIILDTTSIQIQDSTASQAISYSNDTWSAGGTGATMPPKITFTSGAICTDTTFITWLADNATQQGSTNRTLTGQQIADKIDVIITNGAGTQYLANDGTYKTISATPSIDNQSITLNASNQLQAVGLISNGSLVSTAALVSASQIEWAE